MNANENFNLCFVRLTAALGESATVKHVTECLVPAAQALADFIAAPGFDRDQSKLTEQGLIDRCAEFIRCHWEDPVPALLAAWCRGRYVIPPAADVAKQFCVELRRWLTPEQLAEANRRNATPEYAGCCATHDWCDANVAMASAFHHFGVETLDTATPEERETHGCPLSPECDACWNEAWTLAKQSGFTL